MPTQSSLSVIHSCTSNSFSGLESYVLDLATWQHRTEHSVVLFCRERSELAARAAERGIPVWTIGATDRPGPWLWARLRKQWKERLAAGSALLHMHAGGEPWFHLPWLTVRPRGLSKTLLHYHIWINHRKTDPVHRALYWGIDEIWTSSESARAHLATLLPVKRERIRVVPYGRDVQALKRESGAEAKARWRHEIRKQFGIEENQLLGVCIARLERIKGIGELFAAFAQIAPRVPNAHLLIVGDASPKNDEAQAFADDLRKQHAALPDGIRERLHLPGYVADSWRILAASDFYIMPSYEECMSLAMLDALVVGLPVLGTNSGGTPSVARPDETGALVPPADARALASALEEFYSDRDKVKRLGEGARALGASFDQEEIFHRIWDWYEALPPSIMNT
jgi:glycosyltransferase involved in cell wall biosynthesis